ncbi:YdcF family protein [Bartonella sp. HY329]|uniref:YdcF family protein n=1 Tax=unclassified Bartonella TaxID=2645622 RepID=UPI0021C6B42F|nr:MULTISPECIES: YdcF family protein [unclassified Bartonella]UXM95757.1 YdcF family protein [Bartonella sp. HY329]UXN10082.1 YdcF family protein [Bartonella sp. HY328]
MKPRDISGHKQIQPEKGKDDARLEPSRYWRKRFFKHIPPISILVFILFAIFTTGFVYFGEKVDRLMAPDPLPQADGIIVLTGGRARIESGIFLLNQKKAHNLLISGVNPSADSGTLARANHTDPKLFECCIELGREALNTKGNGSESAEWVKKHNFKKIYVVTNDYHMPRSLYIMQQAMPNVELIPYPIRVENQSEDWLSVINHLRVLGIEYLKYIGTRFFKL